MLVSDDLYRFVVSGAGKFPIELLCEEKCYPEAKIDARVISNEQSLLSSSVFLISNNKPRNSVWRRLGWQLIILSGPAHKFKADDFHDYHTWPA